MKTVTFETAKRLWDMGVRIPSEKWYWQEVTPLNPNLHEYGIPQNDMKIRVSYFGAPSKVSTNDVYFEVPAPDAQELLDAFIFLKAWYMGNEYTPAYDIEPYVDIYIIVFKIRLEHDWLVHTKKSKSFPEALAEMLIWLIENKYVTVEQINKGI